MAQDLGKPYFLCQQAGHSQKSSSAIKSRTSWVTSAQLPWYQLWQTSQAIHSIPPSASFGEVCPHSAQEYALAIASCFAVLSFSCSASTSLFRSASANQ